jgi:NADH pyrophosphatase NudC (nudix superfamily)
VWNLLIEHKENQLIITLQDETIKKLLIQENPLIFKSNENIDEFCKKYNLRIENFVYAGKFENLEIELEGISARLSSEIIFFRKKIFTELLIQKLNSRIYKYEDVNNYSLPLKKKEFFLNWKQKQIDEIAIVQKFIQSPFTFDNLEQLSSFQSLNDFSAKNYSQQDLVSETLYWLNNFSKAKKRFEIALNHYSKNEDLRDGVDNLRLTLELLLKRGVL